jgi:hypothetical protein
MGVSPSDLGSVADDSRVDVTGFDEAASRGLDYSQACANRSRMILSWQ